MKTQSQINDRLRAYYNKTVDSPYKVTKPTSYDKRFAPMEYGAIDFDKHYHAQCADLVVDFAYWHSNGNVRLLGDARNLINNDFKGYFKLVPNTKEYIPPIGAIAIYREGTPGYKEFGHTGLVYGNVTQATYTILEQNWNHKANLPPLLRQDNYYGCTHFIVPVVKSDSGGAQNYNKRRILLVAGHGLGYWSNDSGAAANGYTERDFIRKSIVPRVAKHLRACGHTVELYGGETMNQDLFQDTRYGDMVGNHRDYGIYWVANKRYDSVTEFHLDAASPQASGGHVIIGSGLAPDNLDKALHKTISQFVGTIRNIDPRNNLLNVNVAKATGVNYRLVELGFITSLKDMKNIVDQIEGYCFGIAEDIHGGKIVKSSSVFTSKPKKIINKIIPSKAKPAGKSQPVSKPKPRTEFAWTGRFTTFSRNSQPIVVRRAVGLNAVKVDSDSWIYPNQYVDYDRLYKKDGYWWIRFTYPTNPSAGKFYMPIGKIGATEKILVDKTLWGTLSVKSKK